MFYNFIIKFVWVIFQLFWYVLWFFVVNFIVLKGLEIFNIVVQFSVNYIVVYFWGIKLFVYMFVSIIFGVGLYLMVGYFIVEYYMFEKGCEIYFYYGLGNYLIFNVGYYNEYYDFLSILGLWFFLVKNIVVEYYDYLLYYMFWIKVIWDFIIDFRIGFYV